MPDENSTESPLKFPCDFTIKVFGFASAEFETNALGIITKNIAHLSENAIQSRSSANGKYLALSITIHVESKDQLDRIYQELSSSPHIIMAL